VRRGLRYLPAHAAPAVLGFASTPILTRALGTYQFGIYSVCLGLHGVLLTLSADPTTNALRRLYARAAGQADAMLLLSATFGLAVALSVVVAAGATGLVEVILAVTGAFPWQAPVAATAAMTAVFASFQYLLTTLYVRERVGVTSAVQVLHSTAKASALCLGALLVGSATAALMSYTGILLVLSVALTAVARPGTPRLDKRRWKEAIRYGTPLIAVSLAFMVLAAFDRTVLAALDGARVAGAYAATYIVVDSGISLVGMLIHYTVYTSAVTRWEMARVQSTRAIVVGACDVFLVLASAVVAVVGVAGSRIASVVGGNGYAVPRLVPLAVAGGVLLFRLANFEMIGFELTMRPGALAGTFGLAAAFCLPATVAAVAVGGLSGAAVSTLLSYVLFWLLVRRRSPLREVTGYPARRVVAVLLVNTVFIAAARQLPLACGLAVAIVGVPLSVAALLWSRPLLAKRRSDLVASKK